ncbi:S1 family peptidase [Amycolatopsis cihanbeyliensis]|nr:serine protease [Amycolatopsis cihanbeyliensis]
MRRGARTVGVLTAVVALLVTGVQQAAAVRPAIIGGVDADQEYPFMVSLQSSSGMHRCGGSLVAPAWVVTAAHCVRTRTRLITTARIGSTDHTEGGEQVEVAETVTHPDYDPKGAGGDLALVRLATPVRAEPITLGTAPVMGSETRLLGWGQTCPTEGCGPGPRVLQQLDALVVEATGCTAEFAAEVELCTGTAEGDAGTCYGDSGGPQVARVEERWELLGASSRPGNGDRTCATAPSIYTSVPAYAEWITERIAPPSGEDDAVAQPLE